VRKKLAERQRDGIQHPAANPARHACADCVFDGGWCRYAQVAVARIEHSMGAWAEWMNSTMGPNTVAEYGRTDRADDARLPHHTDTSTGRPVKPEELAG